MRDPRVVLSKGTEESILSIVHDSWIVKGATIQFLVRERSNAKLNGGGAWGSCTKRNGEAERKGTKKVQRSGTRILVWRSTRKLTYGGPGENRRRMAQPNAARRVGNLQTDFS